MDYDFINTVSGYKGGKDLVKRHTPGPAADHYMLHLYPDSAIYTAVHNGVGVKGHTAALHLFIVSILNGINNLSLRLKYK